MEITKPSHSWVTSNFGSVDEWMAKNNIFQCAVALVALEIILVADITKHLVLASANTAYSAVLLPTALFSSERLTNTLLQVHHHAKAVEAIISGLFVARSPL